MSTAISSRTAIKNTPALGASINLCAVASAQRLITDFRVAIHHCRLPPHRYSCRRFATSMTIVL